MRWVSPAHLKRTTDDENVSIELVETPRDRRNLGNYLLPVMRKAFAFAKNELKATTLTTQACHRSIYNFAVRFRAPEFVRPKLVTAGHRICIYVEEQTIRRLKSKLALGGVSVSKWMRTMIEQKIT